MPTGTTSSTRSITALMARGDGSCYVMVFDNRYVNLESDLFADGGYTILIVAFRMHLRTLRKIL